MMQILYFFFDMAPSNKSTGNGPEASLLPENVGKRSLNYLETLERVTTAFKKCFFSGIFVLYWATTKAPAYLS